VLSHIGRRHGLRREHILFNLGFVLAWGKIKIVDNVCNISHSVYSQHPDLLLLLPQSDVSLFNLLSLSLEPILHELIIFINYSVSCWVSRAFVSHVPLFFLVRLLLLGLLDSVAFRVLLKVLGRQMLLLLHLVLSNPWVY